MDATKQISKFSSSPSRSSLETASFDLDPGSAGKKGLHMDGHTGQAGQNDRSRVRRIAILVVVSLLEIGARATATLVAQPLKRQVAGGDRDLSVPMLHSLLETTSFPISLIAWISASLYNHGHIYIENWQYRLKMYLLMALVDCISCYTGSIGLNIVPASVFTILGSAAIVFSIILMRIFTDKKFTSWHYLSVVLTFVSVIMLFTKACTGADEAKSREVSKGQDVTSCEMPSHPIGFVWAMLCCLLSAFLIALTGVLNYVFFTHENLKYNLPTILENNALQSCFVAMFLLPVIVTSEESTVWSSVYDQIASNGQLPLFFSVCVGIFLSRPITLFSSVATTAFASAVLTRALGGPRRALVMLMSFLIFKEDMPPIKICSGALMITSTLVYVYGGYQLQQRETEQAKPIKVRDDDVEMQAKLPSR